MVFWVALFELFLVGYFLYRLRTKYHEKLLKQEGSNITIADNLVLIWGGIWSLLIVAPLIPYQLGLYQGTILTELFLTIVSLVISVLYIAISWLILIIRQKPS